MRLLGDEPDDIEVLGDCAYGTGEMHQALADPNSARSAVINKQRKDEILLDVNDVALGYDTKMRWNDEQAWIWSTQPVHEPLVTDDEFRQVQDLIHRKRSSDPPAATTVKRTRHPYQLRGLIFCGICQRRMQGSWNNDKPHYRCVYPTEYAITNLVAHPRSLYLREETITPRLDQWLARAFSPTRLTDTIQALAAAQPEPHDHQADAQIAEARRIIAGCDQRLTRYRAALEAGTDPKLIAGWTDEVETDRAAAEARLRAAPVAKATRLTTEQIGALVSQLGAIVPVLQRADPHDKAEMYTNLGLRLTYHPNEQR